jgi:hypothetical protein
MGFDALSKTQNHQSLRYVDVSEIKYERSKTQFIHTFHNNQDTCKQSPLNLDVDPRYFNTISHYMNVKDSRSKALYDSIQRFNKITAERKKATNYRLMAKYLADDD